MKRAFRQCPVTPAHQPFQVVCAWHPAHSDGRFAELRGLAFGLASSVLHSNRIPAQLCAVGR
eukprot:1349565-Alexandrium_andersonii.AAC.1